MPAHSPAPIASPFSAHDYHIVCLPRGEPSQVNIRASDALPLRVGDQYTIAGESCFCDVVVEEIIHGAGGRWSARCQVSRLLRL